MEEAVAKVKEQANKSAEDKVAALSEVSKLEALVKQLQEEQQQQLQAKGKAPDSSQVHTYHLSP